MYNDSFILIVYIFKLQVEQMVSEKQPSRPFHDHELQRAVSGELATVNYQVFVSKKPQHVSKHQD